MRLLAALSLLLSIGCGTRGGAPDAAAPRPVPAPPAFPSQLAPVGQRTERVLCGDPAESAVRAAARGFVPACDREPRYWRFRSGSHDVTVLRWKTTPDAAPYTWEGRAVLADGQQVIELPPNGPFWTQIAPLSLADADAVALLEVIAATGTGVGRVESDIALTPAEQAALAAQWPAAAAAIGREPPGVARDERGTFLRAWTVRPGVIDPATFNRCARVVRVQLAFVGGTLVTYPDSEVPVEATHDGQPCR